MQVTVKFFSIDRVTIGSDQLVVELPDSSNIRQLIQAIQLKFRSFQVPEGGIHFLVNLVSVDQNEVLHEGDEVLILRQMAGG